MFKNQSFTSPLQPIYWRISLSAFKNLKVLTFVSVMMAAAIAIHSVYVPVGESLRIYFYFLPYFMISVTGGPFIGLCAGFIVDNLSYFLFPFGAYFPGYTLSSMLTLFIFALFCYGRRITWLRLLLTKLTTNLLINVGLGSLWNAILFDKGYYYFLVKSILKNLLMLPIEVLMMGLVFTALRTLLCERSFVPEQSRSGIPLW